MNIELREAYLVFMGMLIGFAIYHLAIFGI